MNDLLNKTVRILFKQGSSMSGVVGVVCRIVGFADGFVISIDSDNIETYYSQSCIKSITLIEEQKEEPICL